MLEVGLYLPFFIVIDSNRYTFFFVCVYLNSKLKDGKICTIQIVADFFSSHPQVNFVIALKLWPKRRAKSQWIVSGKIACSMYVRLNWSFIYRQKNIFKGKEFTIRTEERKQSHCIWSSWISYCIVFCNRWTLSLCNQWRAWTSDAMIKYNSFLILYFDEILKPP